MADRHADEATRSLRKVGFGVRADPTAKYATQDENGRADLMIVRAGKGAYVEVKSGLDSFDLRSWRENQRQWWTEYCKPEPFSMELWFWLNIGVHPPSYNPEKYSPRKAFLFPVEAYLEVEAKIVPYQFTLPYLAGTGYRKEMQEQKLDALTLLDQWKVTWSGNGTWAIPDSHPFSSAYLSIVKKSEETDSHDNDQPQRIA